MRKYANLKEPLKHDEGYIYKIMLYEAEEGFYLFEYDSPEAEMCCADLCYDSLEDLHEDWDELLDEKGWIEIEDPLPECQQDAFAPVRVKGRNVGEPEWRKYEILQDGEWIDFPIHVTIKSNANNEK